MLPTKTTDFASEEYWDNFFMAEQNKPKPSSFEWYGEFERDLFPFITKPPILPSTALVLGCGNSSLSRDLVDLQCATKVVSVDFSKEAIEMMKQLSKRRNYSTDVLEWVRADVTALPKEYESNFDQVWDKGSLDALLGSEELEKENGRKMLREAFRTLRAGGKYYCISLLQPHVLGVIVDTALQMFASVDVLPFVPRKDDSNKSPFLLVFTKSEGKEPCKLFARSQPVQSVHELSEFVKLAQYSFLGKREVRQQWKPNTFVGQFSVFAASNEERFRFQIVDGEKQKIPFAILILPQGREHEWTFSQLEGQLGLANAQGIGRLVFCTLCRDQVFTSMQAVQAELSPLVLEYKPTFASAKNVPFLGIKEELGQRTVLEAGNTELNGPYSIEQVIVNGNTLRRLVFLDNPLAVQSEAVVKANAEVDLEKLSFDIHQAMVEFTHDVASADSSVVVCGVGGGGLVSNLGLRFPNIQSVEIDAKVVELAQKWFVLKHPVVVGDALEFLALPTTNGVDVLIIDINSSSQEAESSTGLICPPNVFLQSDFLQHLANAVLKPETGRLVLNFACRSKDTRTAHLQQLRQTFKSVVALDMKAWNGEDLNMILCCSTGLQVELKKDSEFLDAFRVVQSDGTLNGGNETPSAPTSNNKKKKKKSKKA